MTRDVAKIYLWMLLFGCISIVWFELDPSLKYEMDSVPHRFIGQKIFDPKVRIDTAFVGTSRTWTAIETAELNRRFPNQVSYNFGANWFGRHREYIIVRDLLEHKQVKRIVLETYHEEPTEMHPYSKFLGGFFEFPSSQHVRRRSSYWFLSAALKTRIDEYLTYFLSQFVKSYYLGARRYLTTSALVEPMPAEDAEFGHHTVALTAADQAKFYATIKDIPPKFEVFDDSQLLIRDRYAREIAALALAHGAELYFLFIPERNAPFPGPKYVEFMKELGTPIVLDFQRLYDAELWRDPGHLNARGTAIFTDELARSILFE